MKMNNICSIDMHTLKMPKYLFYNGMIILPYVWQYFINVYLGKVFEEK